MTLSDLKETLQERVDRATKSSHIKGMSISNIRFSEGVSFGLILALDLLDCLDDIYSGKD